MGVHTELKEEGGAGGKEPSLVRHEDSKGGASQADSHKPSNSQEDIEKPQRARLISSSYEPISGLSSTPQAETGAKGVGRPA